MTARAPLVLTGPPGAGKSTLGRALAHRLGRAFVDLDELVSADAGCSIAELFAREGEHGFRAREARLLRSLLESDRVIAAGGGTLLDAALRREALRRAHVLTLEAPLAVLAARVGTGVGRPLLESAPAERLAELLATRAESYAEAHAHLDTAAAIEEVHDRALAQIRALEAHPTLVVPLGARTYRVYVAPLSMLPAHVRALSPSTTVIVTDQNVERALGRTLPVLDEAARVVLAGDGDKSLVTLCRIWDEALALDLDRDGLIVGIGGGLVTDVSGFAAATLLRGVRVAACPTTFLAMVDASIGGKTGIDHARGKNLLGAVHQPSFVLCDPSLLATLPASALREGLAEVVKIALAREPRLVARLHADQQRLAQLDPAALGALIPAAIQAKIDVIVEDERDLGLRELLNFGHTIGHAIEHASGYTLPHGECVALGLRGEIELGRTLGLTPANVADRAIALLDALGLPRVARFDPTRAGEALRRDKKRRAGNLRVALLTADGAAVFPVEHAAAQAACAELAAR